MQRRRPRPVAETGRSCWGSGLQNASAVQGTKQTQGAATRRLLRFESSGDLAVLNTQHLLRKPVCALKAPLGLWLRCCAPPPCSIPVRVKLKIPRANAAAATTVDIPNRWDPNTKKEPTGLFFAACGRPCSFDSSYGLHEKIPDPKIRDFIHDPYGNRTHVTAVKGPCLNRLTNGPYIIQDFAKTASNLSATIATDPQVF